MSEEEHAAEERAPEVLAPEVRAPEVEPATPPAEAAESGVERLRRRARHVGLYVRAFALVALLVVLIAFVVANTGSVKVSWVFGSTRTALVWALILAAVLGWLLGIVTSLLFRWRTRRPRR